MTNTPEKRQILKAINDLHHRVTISDVVSATGLSVAIVTISLNAIASQYRADLEVSSSGTLLYCFEPGFELIHMARGIKGAALQCLARAAKTFIYLLKISFGVLLIASSGILYVVMAFLQLIFSVCTGNSDEAVARLPDTWNIFNRAILSDLLRHSHPDSQERQAAEGNQGLLLQCFSYLFGDGDPNSNISAERWLAIGHVISRNHGLVIAEQFAPYTGADSESSVLEIIVHYNGFPMVSDSGHIVYSFPVLQAQPSEFPDGKTPAFLLEKPLIFSSLPDQARRRVIGLALFTVASSAFIVGLISIAQRHATPHILGWMLCLVYGCMFIIVPGMRAIWLTLVNRRIKARNKLRETYAEQYVLAAGELSQKKQELQVMQASQPATITQEQTVYSTKRDDLEQQFDNLK